MDVGHRDRQALDPRLAQLGGLLGDRVGVAGHRRLEPHLGHAGSPHRVELCDRRLMGRRDQHDRHRGLRDLGRITAELLAVRLQHAELVPSRLLVPEQVAAVSVLSDHPQRLALAAAADENRDVAADRLGIVVGAVHVEMCAVEGRALLREHQAADLQRVLEPLEAFLERREVEPVREVLVLEPGGADAEPGAAAGDDVERRGGFRQQRRVAVGDAADERAERERRGAGGDRGEHRLALEHPVLLGPDAGDLVQVVHQRD